MYTDILISLLYITFLTIFAFLTVTVWKSYYYLRVIKEILYEVFGSSRGINTNLKAIIERYDYARRENDQGTDKE